MNGSIPNLCKHAFFLGKECPLCAEDALLDDLIDEAIARLLNTTTLAAGVEGAETTCYENFRFINILKNVREVLDKTK